MSPILDIQRRYRELGRIRMGEKGAKGQPVKLTQWRLTSSNRGLLEVAAALWGGQVKDWTGGPDEGLHELHTATGELPIVIPPGVSPCRSGWSSGPAGAAPTGATGSATPSTTRRARAAPRPRRASRRPGCR